MSLFDDMKSRFLSNDIITKYWPPFPEYQEGLGIANVWSNDDGTWNVKNGDLTINNISLSQVRELKVLAKGNESGI